MISLSKIIIPLVSFVSLISAGQAPFNKDSSKKLVARANFDTGKLHGVLKFQAPNGTVRVHLDVTGLPSEGGPFQYHIHKLPVPNSGSCEATETHFNPYDAPPDCDALQDDSYCQVGDLSGKHGWINTTCFETRYWDPYLSLNPKNKAYPVGLSVNFHFANLTRFACANIELSKEKVDKKEGGTLDAEDIDDEMEDLVPLRSELGYNAEDYDLDTDTLFDSHKNEAQHGHHNRYNHSNSTSNISNYSSPTDLEWEDEENSGSKNFVSSLGQIVLAAILTCAVF